MNQLRPAPTTANLPFFSIKDHLRNRFDLDDCRIISKANDLLSWSSIASKTSAIFIQLSNLLATTSDLFGTTSQLHDFGSTSPPNPRIDYTLKAVGGSLTAIPGLSDMIDDTVNSIVSDQLQWPHRIVVPLGGVDIDASELELRPQGKVTVTVAKAASLKNMEMIGKSDPYVRLHIRPMFKVKTKVINNNLNPVWNETFELIAEDKETQALILEVFDEDNLAQDKRLGTAKVPLIDLEPETTKEYDLKLLPSLDMLKIKDKKDRGTVTVKVLYHEYTKDEQQAAFEEEKRILEERRRLKESGMIGSTMDALGGAASLVGSGVGLVGTGVGAGVGLVGSGIGAGAGIVGSGLGVVGSGLSKAGKFMGKSITNQFSSARKTGSSAERNGS